MLDSQKIKSQLATKLSEAQKAEAEAFGPYKALFERLKDLTSQKREAEAKVAAINSDVLKVEEEIAPARAQAAPAFRKVRELERIDAVLPLVTIIEPFSQAFGTLPEDARRKAYGMLPPVRDAVVRYARTLKDSKGQPVLAADAKKLTERVWQAVETELNAFGTLAKAHGITF